MRQAVVIPGHGYPRPERHRRHARASTTASRRTATREPIVSRSPSAFAEPLYERRSLPELDRCKNELGIAGISFHTRFQGASMDSPWILRYVERMGELGMVPVLHAMTESPDEALWKAAEIARAFPDMRCSCSTRSRRSRARKERSDIAELCPNLLFDTSLSYNFDFIEVFAKRFGADRVVFGTDLYSPPLGRRISHLVPQILESSLRTDKVKIFGGNARALFALP